MVIETLSGLFLDTHSRYRVFITAANECSTAGRLKARIEA